MEVLYPAAIYRSTPELIEVVKRRLDCIYGFIGSLDSMVTLLVPESFRPVVGDLVDNFGQLLAFDSQQTLESLQMQKSRRPQALMEEMVRVGQLRDMYAGQMEHFKQTVEQSIRNSGQDLKPLEPILNVMAEVMSNNLRLAEQQMNVLQKELEVIGDTSDRPESR